MEGSAEVLKKSVAKMNQGGSAWTDQVRGSGVLSGTHVERMCDGLYKAGLCMNQCRGGDLCVEKEKRTWGWSNVKGQKYVENRIVINSLTSRNVC